MPFTTDTYCEHFTSPLPALHQEVLEYTLQYHTQAHMVSGHLQGQLLRFLSAMLRPLRVLEVGTFTGFSALCLAEGLMPQSLLYTIELREQDAALAQSFFARSPWSHQIRSLVGHAAGIIPQLTESWDLVFIDADKTGYINYYNLLIARLSTNGLLLADNILFHGEVLQEPVAGKNAKAIAAFNAHVQADERVEQLSLPVRDGLMLVRKR
ncbi:MAG TPA: class I SAM-dependent methyltransferase [Phnomibacter sp.]|nr:class I SAM-dependent methyltransferase [Phnomibacter sp.]